VTQQEIDQGRKKLYNGFWGWLIAATIMLAAAALLGQQGQWCLTVVPLFLFFVCLFLVMVAGYGLTVLTDKEEALHERERKIGKVIK
jgi:predicted tellurium resistance membrane protein TerC